METATDNGVAHSAEFVAVDFKGTLELNGINSEYDLIKCGCCGHPWSEHSSVCFNHVNKDRHEYVAKIVSSTPEMQKLLKLVKVNSCDEILA